MVSILCLSIYSKFIIILMLLRIVIVALSNFICSSKFEEYSKCCNIDNTLNFR